MNEIITNQNLFRRIFDESPIAIFIYSKDGLMMELNNSALKIFGVESRDNILGLSLFDNPAVKRTAIIELPKEESIRFQSTIDFDKIREMGFYNPLRSGLAYLDWTITKLRTNGFLVQIQDITERKLSEAALKESEEKFRCTFDFAPIGAAIVSLDYKFQKVNNEFCKITGYNREELLSMGFPDITHPDDLETDINFVMQLANGTIDHYSMDKRYINKNGEFIWAHLSVRLMKDSNGNPLYYIPLIENINDRKIAERKIFYSEQRYRNLIEKAPFGIAIFKEDRIFFVNNTLLNMYGFTSFDELKQKQLTDYIHSEERENIIKKLKKLMDGSLKCPVIIEHRIVRQTGEVHFWKLFVSDFYEVDIHFFQLIIFDITEELKNEKQKKQLLADSLFIQQKNKQILKLNELIARNFKTYKYKEKDINEIENIFRQLLNIEKDKERIMVHFEELHGNFLSKLKETFPLLTSNDLRHCAYIKLKFSTKEIAFLNNIQATSVQRWRVRLKKKLLLNREQDLFDFLENFYG